jgi:AraC-like DNA-binding protein
MKCFAAEPRSCALRPFIKAFHYQETALPFALERIMPNGQAHLMVNLGEKEFRTYSGLRGEQQHCHSSGVVLVGPHSKPVVIDTLEQHCFAVVEFHSGGANQFFRPPMSAVGNQVVQLEDIWSEDAKPLRERLLEAATPAAKFRVLEDLLTLHFAPIFDPAIVYAIGGLRAGLPLSNVVSRLGISRRTFERRFSAQVGMTPKRFGRVQRLQRVLRSVRASSSADWCCVAAEHGYCDQAHLIHDFRELAGMTPSGYVPHSLQRSNHVPIAAA